MSKDTKGISGWLVLLAILGGAAFYSWREKSKPVPVPQPERPPWSLDKYDLGKFYFSRDLTTEFRAVCESADCTALLDEVHIGILGVGDLKDVKQKGLHLTIKQNGTEYQFKIEAIVEKSRFKDESQ